MTTPAHRVLDYALPYKLAGFHRVAAAAGLLIAFAAAGGFFGVLVGRLALKPTNLSSTLLQIREADSWMNVLPPLPQASQLSPIVAAALIAARKDPSGRSLPSSASEAFGSASFKSDISDLVLVTYSNSDPKAAACMARELVNAYTNAIATFNGGWRPSVCIIATKTGPNSVRNGVPFVGGLLGTVIGIALLLVGASFRRTRPNPTA